DKSYASHIPAFLLVLLCSNKCAQRRVPSLVLRHPDGDVFLDLPLKVVAQLFIQLIFDTIAPEERTKPQRHGVQPAFETHCLCLLELHDFRDNRRQAVLLTGLSQEPGIGTLFISLSSVTETRIPTLHSVSKR